MKHLKLFEHLSYKDMEIKEFCENHLAYLIDIGFKIDLEHVQSNSIPHMKKRVRDIKITLFKSSELYPNQRVKWDEIKDDFIPFIQVFNNKYNIIKIGLYGFRKDRISNNMFVDTKEVTLDDIINDTIIDYDIIGKIFWFIKE